MSSPEPNPNSSSSGQTLPTPESASGLLMSQAMTLATVGLTLLAGWILFAWFAIAPSLGQFEKTDSRPTHKEEPKSKPSQETSKQASSSTPTVQTRQPTVASTSTVPANSSSDTYASDEAFVLMRLQRTEFQAKTAQLQRAVDLLQTRLQNWNRRLQSLMTSDEGKLLAQSAGQFRCLQSLVPTTADELRQWQTIIAGVRTAFLQAERPLAKLDEYDSQIKLADTQVRSANAKFDSMETTLAELIALGKRAAVGKTLAEALAALDQQAIEQIEQAVQAEKTNLEKSHTQELAKLKKLLDGREEQLAKAQEDFKASTVNADKKLVEAQAKRDEQIQQLAQQRSAARKSLDQELPAFRDRLSPFITKGYRQLTTRHQHVVVIEAQPVSYSALLRVGALEDDVKGLETLLLVSDTEPVHSRNDRPVGAFPKYVNWEFDGKNPEIIRQLKAVQAFLRRHGEAMVEAKLLAP